MLLRKLLTGGNGSISFASIGFGDISSISLQSSPKLWKGIIVSMSRSSFKLVDMSLKTWDGHVRYTLYTSPIVDVPSVSKPM